MDNFLVLIILGLLGGFWGYALSNWIMPQAPLSIQLVITVIGSCFLGWTVMNFYLKSD